MLIERKYIIKEYFIRIIHICYSHNVVPIYVLFTIISYVRQSHINKDINR